MAAFLEEFTRPAGTLYLPPQTDLTGWKACPFAGNGAQLVIGAGPWPESTTYVYNSGYASRDTTPTSPGYWNGFDTEADASEWWRFHLSTGSPGPHGTGQIKVRTGLNTQAWVTVEWTQGYGVTVRNEGETVGSTLFVEHIATTVPTVLGLRWGQYGNYLAVELDGVVVGSVYTLWDSAAWQAGYTPATWHTGGLLPVTVRAIQPVLPEDINAVTGVYSGTLHQVLDAMTSWWPWTGGEPVGTVRPALHQRRNDTLAPGGAWRRTQRTQQAGSLWRRAPL